MALVNREDLVEMALNPPEEFFNVPASVTAVFNNEMLLEMILERVILQQTLIPQKMDKDIRSLRLVSRSWLTSVNKLLCKNSLPLIKFHLIMNGIGLEKFVKMYISNYPTSNYINAPTFSLNLTTQFFISGNFHSLQNCLEKCGQTLVELDVHLNTSINLSYDYLFYTLPNLKKLKLVIRKPFMVNVAPAEMQSQPRLNEILNECHAKISILIKALLEGSTTLNELILLADDLRPLDFSNFVFPQTINTLYIRMHEESEILVLSRKNIPLLTNLHLEIFGLEIEAEHVLNVINNWRKSLTNLCVRFSPVMFTQNAALTTFSFPLMEKLQELEFCGVHSSQVDNLQLCFPNLNRLHLILPPADFQTWVRNSCYSSVTKLTVELYQYPTSMRQIVPIDLETIQRINQTFPNLEKVELHILGSEGSVVRYIFKEMGNLKNLDLKVIDTERITAADVWDALLIGTRPEAVKAARDNGVNLDEAEIDNTVSLANLKELETMHLESVNTTEYFGNQTLLISEMAFTQGFLKVPRLTFLALSGRFKITADMLATFGVELQTGLYLV